MCTGTRDLYTFYDKISASLIFILHSSHVLYSMHHKSFLTKHLITTEQLENFAIMIVRCKQAYS